MSPARLLEHFDRLIDTPDAVPRLRRFILDLAVRGKLVEQDPKDEPAGELLKRIQTEKTRLVKAGEIRKERPLPPVDEDTTPFGLPSLWEWASIRQITTDRGQKIPEKKFSYVDVSAINKERGEIADLQVLTPDAAPSRARKIVKKGDVIYSCVRPYLLNIAVVEKDFNPEPIVSTAFAVLNGFGLIHPRYLWIVLRSPFFVECVEGKMRGQAYPAINDADFAPLPVPLPPLAEQTRIVAKVDELMALCDELEAAQTKRERRRDSLVAATLHGLGRDGSPNRSNPKNGCFGETALPGSFEESARFYFNHLSRLTTRPEHIHQLRQTILNLAVRGKLVPQDPKDKPSVGVAFTKVQKSEIPFEIPESWGWTRLKNLGPIRGGGTPSKARPELWGGDIPWVSPKDMKRDYIDGAQMSITAKGIEESAVKLIETGSILFVVRGMILAHSFPVALAMVPVTVNQDMKALTPRLPAMGEFILRVLKGLRDGVLSKVQRSSHGTCRLESSDYEDLLFPLPPLAEQRRIVAKVDELMTLCDGLETGLSCNASTQEQFLGAVLNEALSAGA